MSPAAYRAGAASTDAHERAHLALLHLLDELASVLLQVPPSVYTVKPLPGVSGSIGEHVRHVLDHVAAFSAARPYSVLSYDGRERGTAVESDTAAALRAILRLKSALMTADDDQLDAPVAVTSILTRGHAAVCAWSTLRRELAFVVSHTVHHQALIAVLMSTAGVGVPDAFGLAPSTPRRNGS